MKGGMNKMKKIVLTILSSIMMFLLIGSNVAIVSAEMSPFESAKVTSTTQNSVSTTTGSSTGSGQIPTVPSSGGGGGGSVSSDLTFERTIGENNAPVTMEMYTDFQGSWDAKWYRETYPLVKANYIDNGKVKLIIKNYPLSILNANSDTTARAALCAAQLQVDYPYENPLYYNTFYGYIDFLYNRQDNVDTASLKQYAGIMGVDSQKFEDCLYSQQTTNLLNAEISQANRIGVKGSPSFFINGKLFSGGAAPYSSFEKELDDALRLQSATLLKEQVKCVFEGTKTEQKCYVSGSKVTFSCSGFGTCTSSVAAEKGTELIWKSSCGGYAYTTVDGVNEQVTFKCSNTIPGNSPDLVINNLKVYQQFDEKTQGTATWVEYDLKNIGNGDVFVDGKSNQGFLNTVYIDGKSIGSIWFWKGLGDNVTTDSQYQNSNVPALKAGESIHRAHRFYVYYEGTHKVSVKADSYVVMSGPDVLDESYDNLIVESNEENNMQTILYTFGSSTTPAPEPQYVKVYLTPEKQTSRDGTARYTLTVQDLRNTDPRWDCPKEGPCPSIALTPMAYELYFYSNQDIKGNFGDNILYLKPGEKASTTLDVKSDQIGSNIFEVIVKSPEVKVSTKGILIFGEDTQPIPTHPVYFDGQGYGTSSSGRGILFDLNLLNDEETIKGKMFVEGYSYKIQGSTSGNSVKFDLFTANSAEEIASFVGSIKEYDSFFLLEGDLTPVSNNAEKWHLTAFSPKEKLFNVIEIPAVSATSQTETSFEKVKIDSVITVTEGSSMEKVSDIEAEETYIRPVKIKKEKFLRIIPKPNARNVLEVEITQGDKTTKEDIREDDMEKVSSYSISVGSLADEQNIELSVRKA